MKWSIWAICTCDRKVNLGFYCWDIGFSSLVCTLYRCPLSARRAADPRMDGRLQAGLKARSLQITTRRTVLEMCSLCVCSALRKENGFTFFLYFSPGWMGGLARGRDIVNLSGSALSGKANFARLDCKFCFVLFVCVFFPSKALFFSPHSALSPHPYFYFLCWVRERKYMLNS